MVDFSPARSTTVYLMANDGYLVHTWDNVYVGTSHYLEADGSYSRVKGATYGPAELAWTAAWPPDRFAPFISGATRLQNGNTFVCACTDGVLLELSLTCEIVWRYRNLYNGNLLMADGKPATAGTERLPFAFFRGPRIPVDHAGEILPVPVVSMISRCTEFSGSMARSI